MCVVTKKGFHSDYPCYHHLADLLSVSIQKRKNHHSFVGSCPVSLLYSRHVRFTPKEQNDNQNVVAERCLFQDEEDLVVNKVPLSEYCSKFQHKQ